MTLLRAVAQIKFKGNRKIEDSSIDKFRHKHYVSDEAYASMKSKWQRKEDFCTAWEFDVVKWYDEPLYFPYGGDTFM